MYAGKCAGRKDDLEISKLRHWQRIFYLNFSHFKFYIFLKFHNAIYYFICAVTVISYTIDYLNEKYLYSHVS